MTYVAFNVHRVMAQVRARTKQTQEVNYKILEEILDSIKVAVDDQKHNFQQYIQAAQAQGLSQAEIWKLAKEQLQTHVSLRTLYRWAHEYLTEEAFMTSKQEAVSHRKIVSVDKWQQDLQEQIDNNPAPATEITQITNIEEYDRFNIEQYSKEILIDIVTYEQGRNEGYLAKINVLEQEIERLSNGLPQKMVTEK